MNQDQWNEYLRRSKTWSIRMGHDLLHSDAYRALKYGPAIKTLNWFHEKLRYEKVKKFKRGDKRYRLISEEMSFTYKEARLRGLTQNQFSKSLKLLCKHGFIDVKKPGSGLQGDYTVYVLSQRWRDFGTPQFIEKEFPRAVDYGYRGKKQRTKTNVVQRFKLIVRKSA